MPGKKGKNGFQQMWLSIDSADYIDWLSASSKGDSMAYCKLCRRDFTIENMGKAAITSHGNSKKHVAYSSAQNNSISLKSLFASRSNNSESVVQVSNCGADEASTSAQQEPTTSAQEAFTTVQGTPNTTIHRFLLKEEVTKAEILWSIYSVLSYSSKRAAASAAEGFPAMFPDSEIAKKFTCAKDKIGYLVTFGLASHFIDELKQTIHGIPFFTILFDESMNKIAQRGQMDLHIRFCMNDIVRTRYLTSVLMGRARAEDLLKCFHDGTAGLDQDKILHTSMDGPNVNKKFLELYKSSRDEDMHKLNELGSCSLRVICGSPKNADEKTVGFRGKTTMYGRNGKRLEQFYSVLPGGSSLTAHKGYSMFDCVVCYDDNTFYCLDMIAWTNLSVMQCETSFRFEWIRSRLEENEYDLTVISDNNAYKFVAMSYCPCDREGLQTVLERPGFEVELVGVFFYHKETYYTHGQTPLVGWLKPYMLEEILGVPVPEPLMQHKPEKFTSLTHIEYHSQRQQKEKARKKARQEKKLNSMDTTPPPSEMSGGCNTAQEDTSPTEQSTSSSSTVQATTATTPPLPSSEQQEPPDTAEMADASPTVAAVS